MKKIILIAALLACAGPARAVVTATVPRTTVTAAGGTNVTFAFKTTSTSHLQVFLDDVLISTGYSVTLYANQDSSPGGTVVFTSPPTVGTKIVVQRTVPLAQMSVWTPYVTPKAENVGAALDNLEFQIQQLARDGGGSGGGGGEAWPGFVDWSQITNAPTTWAWSAITGKPTIPPAYVLPSATSTTLGGVYVPVSPCPQGTRWDGTQFICTNTPTGHAISGDSGLVLPQRDTLWFRGAGIICSDTGSQTQCIVDGSSVYTLPPAGATTLGGVKGSKCPAGQYSDGWNTDGSISCVSAGSLYATLVTCDGNPPADGSISWYIDGRGSVLCGTDTTAPVVSSMTFGTPVSRVYPITSFVATDNVAVMSYAMIANAACSAVSSWSASVPTSYDASALGDGSFTIRGCAKDAAGNISTGYTIGITLVTSIAIPSPSPGAGIFSGSQRVSLTSTSSGATVCYTTDGSAPAATTPGTCSAGTTLTNGGSVLVEASETLKYIATKAGATGSSIGTSAYTIGSTIANVSHLLGPSGTPAALDYSNPAMPGYGNTVCDGNYSTNITRITGTAGASVPTTWATNSSLAPSTWRTADDLHGPESTYGDGWNADGTRLILKNVASGGWLVMDGAAPYHPLYLIPNNALGECRWDPSLADRMICVSAAGVVNYLQPSSLAAASPSPVVTEKWNPSSAGLTCTGATMGRYEGRPSNDGRRVPIMGTCGGVKKLLVVDLVAGSVLLSMNESDIMGQAGWPAGLTQVDSFKIDPDNTGLAVAVADYRASFPVTYTGVSTYTIAAPYATDHEQIAMNQAGASVAVWGGGATMFALPAGTPTSIATVGATGSAAAHTLRSPSLATGWAGGVNNGGTGSYQGEIFAFPLKAGGAVKRLGRHRSEATTYTNSPMPVFSNDGLRVVFGSRWASSGSSPTWGFVLDATTPCSATGQTAAPTFNALTTPTAVNPLSTTGVAVGDSTVRVYEQGNSTPLYTTTAASNGSYTVVWFEANDGNHTYYATAQTTGETESVASTTRAVVVDRTAPTVSTFTVPGTSTTLAVSITALTATDPTSGGVASGVSGYAVTEGACSAVASWSGSAPTTYTVSAAGSYTLRGCARDAAGNKSTGLTAAVTVTLPQASTPTFSPVAGAVSSGTVVTISSSSSGCGSYIYWNTTGSPTTGSTHSTSATVSGAETIYAKVIGCPAYSDSAVGSAAYTLASADDFNRTDGGLGTGWTTVPSCAAPRIVGNIEKGAAGGAESAAYWNGGTPSANQFSQGTAVFGQGTVPNDGSETSAYATVVVRASTSAKTFYAMRAYGVWREGGAWEEGYAVYKYVNGTYTNISAYILATGAIAGKVIRLEVSGTTLTMKINGTTSHTAVDSSISTGSYGVYGNGDYGGLDDWSGGDL